MTKDSFDFGDSGECRICHDREGMHSLVVGGVVRREYICTAWLLQDDHFEVVMLHLRNFFDLEVHHQAAQELAVVDYVLDLCL